MHESNGICLISDSALSKEKEKDVRKANLEEKWLCIMFMDVKVCWRHEHMSFLCRWNYVLWLGTLNLNAWCNEEDGTGN